MVTWYVGKCIYRYALLMHAMNVLQWSKKVLLSYPNTLEMRLMYNKHSQFRQYTDAINSEVYTNLFNFSLTELVAFAYSLHYKQCMHKWYTWADVHTIVIQ